MADTSQGEGWWQASDGKWYAPEAHPDYKPPPPAGQKRPIDYIVDMPDRLPAPPRAGSQNPRVVKLIADGYTIQSEDEHTVVMYRPRRRPNHVLHLILTILTVGLWGLVWILVSVTGQAKTEIVQKTAA